MTNGGETRFWSEIWPMIVKCPIAVFGLVMTLLMGYGISFMVFDYRTNPKGISHILHIALGTGYACCIFVITGWNLIFSDEKNLTLEDIAAHCPKVMILSFAILVLVMIVVTVVRERKK